jgi:hypothetical protein
VAGLCLALLAAAIGLVVVVRDRADTQREVDSLQEQLDQQRSADSSAPDAPEPTTPPPSSTPERDGGSDPLDDLLGGLFGGSGAPQLDPACLGLDGGGLLDGLAGDPIDGDLEQQVAKITELVQTQRGLRFEHPVQPEFLASDEFDRRVADQVDAEYPASQADVDGRVLSVLGAVPKGTDMKSLQRDLMTGQVAGFYDPETGDLVVRVPEGGGNLDANGQVTLAHELDHALTDQALGLPDTAEDGESDANLARLALVEGDASLLMQQVAMQSLGLLGQLGAATSPEAAEAQRQLERVPAYVQAELMYPYLTGLEYACRLYTDGGWPTLDAAYRDLPRTSAEILFAEDAGLTPADPRDVERLTGGWKVAEQDTLGAVQLLWLMQAPGGDQGKRIDDALEAARHWAGGELALSTRGDESALGVALVDDRDGGMLCSAVERWYQAAFDTSRADDGDAVVMNGDGQVGVLRCEGRDVRLGIAPDAATAATLAR